MEQPEADLGREGRRPSCRRDHRGHSQQVVAGLDSSSPLADKGHGDRAQDVLFVRHSRRAGREADKQVIAGLLDGTVVAGDGSLLAEEAGVPAEDNRWGRREIDRIEGLGCNLETDLREGEGARSHSSVDHGSTGGLQRRPCWKAWCSRVFATRLCCCVDEVSQTGGSSGDLVDGDRRPCYVDGAELRYCHGVTGNAGIVLDLQCLFAEILR